MNNNYNKSAKYILLLIDRYIGQMLKIQDLNSIIKYFATQINKRILELESTNRNSKVRTRVGTESIENYKQNAAEVNTQQQQKIDQNVRWIACNYQNYSPANQVETEYMRKMIYRVLQIFGFFKWKCRNQSILNHIQRQLTNKLNLLINQSPISVGKIMSYVVQISKKQFVSCKTGHPLIPSKSNTIATGFIKSKRRLYSRSQTKQIKQAVQSNPINIETVNTFDLSNKKRTSSVICSYNPNYIHPIVQVIDKLYNGMNIDKPFISKFIESQSYLTKDQIKRNKSIFKKVQTVQNKILDRQLNQRAKSISSSFRKIKTEASQLYENKNVLTQIKFNAKPIEKVSKFQLQDQLDKVPVINMGSFAKKRCKVKTTCWKKIKDKKIYSNQNNFV